MQSGDMPSIKAVLCTGLYHGFTDIWAADSVGQISVWDNPIEKGLDFTAKLYWRAHYGAINDMLATPLHVITISDDGYVIIHDMARYTSIRTIHIVTWCLDKQLLEKPEIPRRIKCLQITNDATNGGTMVLGTSYGEVMVCAIGTTL